MCSHSAIYIPLLLSLALASLPCGVGIVAAPCRDNNKDDQARKALQLSLDHPEWRCGTTSLTMYETMCVLAIEETTCFNQRG